MTETRAQFKKKQEQPKEEEICTDIDTKPNAGKVKEHKKAKGLLIKEEINANKNGKGKQKHNAKNKASKSPGATTSKNEKEMDISDNEEVNAGKAEKRKNGKGKAGSKNNNNVEEPKQLCNASKQEEKKGKSSENGPQNVINMEIEEDNDPPRVKASSIAASIAGNVHKGSAKGILPGKNSKENKVQDEIGEGNNKGKGKRGKKKIKEDKKEEERVRLMESADTLNKDVDILQKKINIDLKSDLCKDAELVKINSMCILNTTKDFINDLVFSKEFEEGDDSKKNRCRFVLVKLGVQDVRDYVPMVAALRNSKKFCYICIAEYSLGDVTINGNNAITYVIIQCDNHKIYGHMYSGWRLLNKNKDITVALIRGLYGNHELKVLYYYWNRDSGLENRTDFLNETKTGLLYQIKPRNDVILCDLSIYFK